MFDPSKIPIPADLAPYKFRPVLLKLISEWRECGTFEEIFALKEGLSKDMSVHRRFGEEGRQWVRLREVLGRSFVDLEILPNGNIGEVRPVPPEQAVPESVLLDFTFWPALVRGLLTWQDYDTFDNLLDMHDGPFGSYGLVRRFSEGSREFARMVKAPKPSFVDIEILSDGKIGEIRPVPPLEAFVEAESKGWAKHYLGEK